jgi:hypothetical protein
MLGGMRIAVALVALLAAPSPLVLAAERVPVPIHETHGIRWYNAGVGIDEREATPQIFPLKLVFVDVSGAYVGKVAVTVSGRGREDLEITANSGPWLFLDLPPGTWTIVAAFEGVSTKTVITLAPGEMKTEILSWR